MKNLIKNKIEKTLRIETKIIRNSYNRIFFLFFFPFSMKWGNATNCCYQNWRSKTEMRSMLKSTEGTSQPNDGWCLAERTMPLLSLSWK